MTEMPAIEGKSEVGRLFTWKNDGGMYTVGYTDWILEPLEEDDIRRISSENIIRATTRIGGKLVSTSEFRFEGYSGTETRLRLQGNFFIYRHIANGNRLYLLSARWPEHESGDSQIARLNSFRINE